VPFDSSRRADDENKCFKSIRWMFFRPKFGRKSTKIEFFFICFFKLFMDSQQGSEHKKLIFDVIRWIFIEKKFSKNSTKIDFFLICFFVVFLFPVRSLVWKTFFRYDSINFHRKILSKNILENFYSSYYVFFL